MGKGGNCGDRALDTACGDGDDDNEVGFRA